MLLNYYTYRSTFFFSDHEHAEVRQVSGHPEHGGLEVFLMASQVYEGDDLRGLLTDFGPVQTSSMAIRFVHHLWGYVYSDIDPTGTASLDVCVIGFH